MESVPPVLATPGKNSIARDSTVVMSPSVGGGVGRFVDYSDNGNCLIDIKGVIKEFAEDEFSAPERSLSTGNDWFHMSVDDETPGLQKDKPEFRPGDMVKIADVYGTVIGPGFGVFIGYGTTGEDCIILFDGKQIVVPVENVAAVLEQDAKDNFDQTDNDGNLSPMSLGSDNVKIEQEPAMDRKDEFSKWMSAVDEALTSEDMMQENPAVMGNGCGCQQWDCPTCFPQDGMDNFDDMGSQGDVCPHCGHAHGEEVAHDDYMATDDEFSFGDGEDFEVVDDEYFGNTMEDDAALDDFISKGGKIQQLPYMNRPRNPGQSFGSKHIGSVTGRGSRGQQRGANANVAVGKEPSGKPVVSEEEPLEMGQESMPRSKDGRGVKLGDIVQKTEYRKVGQDSPMTHGGDNLDEEIPGGANPDDYGGARDYAMAHFGNLDGQKDVSTEPKIGGAREYAHNSFGNLGEEEPSEEDIVDATEMISVIKNMQTMGLSNANDMYSEEDLANMSIDELRQVQDEVLGGVSEATTPPPKPTKKKYQEPDFDFGDILNPRDDQLPAMAGGSDDDFDRPVDDTDPMQLPAANPADTRRRTQNITPTDTMRDFMNRINPTAGAGEPDLEPEPANQVTVRTAQDVPAVISQAMRTTGMVSPEWHGVRHLPGFSNRNIRGMGRQVFGMFTRTPVEQIQTIANVNGQGPNSSSEVRSVAAWLMQNAEDMGDVELNFGAAIPGYTPDVKEFRINGVRFHVVRDPMGEYIYAYPDRDSVTGGPLQDRLGRNNPRLREDEDVKFQLSILEEIELNEKISSFIDEAFGKPPAADRKKRQQAGYEKRLGDYEKRKSAGGDEFNEPAPKAPVEKSMLSKIVGRKLGGKNLIDKLHKSHRLSNEAQLEPVSVSSGKAAVQLAWGQFNRNPDDFVVVSGAKGVAGIKPEADSVADFRARAEKEGKTPQFSKHGGSIKYQVVAYTDDGNRVPPELLRQKKYKDDRYPDPTVVKARMGLVHGRDNQNPDNIFNLLDAQIGPIQAVWLAGWQGNRGKGEEGSDEFSPGAVERDKMATRAEYKKGTTYTQQEAENIIFNKIKPILKNMLVNLKSLALRRKERFNRGEDFAGERKMVAALERFKEINIALDTGKEFRIGSSYTFSQAFNRALSLASRPYIEEERAKYQAAVEDANRKGIPPPPKETDEDRYVKFLNEISRSNSVALRPIIDSLRDSFINGQR